MKIINYLSHVIEYSFYALFLLVPLVFSSSPSELFEFPKMWLTFGITILIGTAWLAKMILQKQIRIQRTPLDIPIFLFLASQIISTIYSIDPHVSLWGYYSRFNGGLLSVISYLLLYYALVSNLGSKHVLNLIKVSLFSGLIVALWGLPSHFGYDPTCFIFRGNFDTSCWTETFKPTIRIFSTLGQPAWLAAYMGVLLPISMALAIQKTQNAQQIGESDHLRVRSSESLANRAFRVFWKNQTFFILLSILFYTCLTYTDTRGGFIGFWVANIAFWGLIYFKKILNGKIFLRYFLIFQLSFLIFNFFQGVPISQVSKFTLPHISEKIQSVSPPITQPKPAAGELEGTDSGKIRLLVWQGAVDAWRDHPIIGTGVETFAFAYYKYKPAAHNLTSEWDFLYNKAHNEYLNYLATTGILGLGSYLAIIAAFLIIVLTKNANPFANFAKNEKDGSRLSHTVSDFRENNGASAQQNLILIFALLSSYLSILVSNFFGFSVVIINLYFFLIPAFVFVLGNFLNPEKSIIKTFGPSVPSVSSRTFGPTRYQYALLAGLLFAFCFLLFALVSYWQADINYAKGANLDKASSYQEAIAPLQKAVSAKPNEPVYIDELSINLGTLAASLYLQKDASSAAQLAQEAVALNNDVVNSHPNNIVYWKNRVRLFYTLAQGDKAHEKIYLKQALTAITRAQALAPRDAKISYNVGVLAEQTAGPKKGIEILENTVRLKPDYRDAYFALGLFYNQLASDPDGNIIDPALQKKAVENLKYILKNIDPQDKQAKESLKNWNTNSSQ